VAAVARKVANVLKQGFASDETVSSVYETRLKQSACSMAARSVLTKCAPAASPNPCLGCEPLEDHPALEKGRCPAAFFFCRQANCTSPFSLRSRLAALTIELHTRVSASGRNVHFAPGLAELAFTRTAVSVALKSKAPPEGSRRG